MEINWGILLENSQEKAYRKIFGKREEKAAFESDKESEFRRDDLPNKDGGGRFVKVEKYFVKVTSDQFWSKR